MPAITTQQALEIAIQHHQSGRLAEAEGLYHRILATEPNHADAWHLLGLIAHGSGALDTALDLIRKAIALQPAVANFHNNLGNALKDRGQLDESIAAYRRAIEITPDFAMAHNNLGNALRDRGQLDEAIAAYRCALQSAPDFALAHYNLGTTLNDRGRRDEAIVAYRRALQLQPDFALAHNNLGNALAECDRLDEAIASFGKALQFQPDFALAHNNLGNALKDQGRAADAAACFERAAHLQPDSAAIHSNLLATLHYCASSTAAALFEAHCEFDGRHAAPLRAQWQPHLNSADPDRRLRLGFISPHFARHAVGHFLIRLLENLDPRKFEIICYSDTPAADAMTARIKAVASAWHEVTALADDGLAARIRSDAVDILFDLAGHTAGNRLLVFARKPAPIQITWVDYVGTTGLAAIDYIIADPRQIPPGAEPWVREKVLRMPDDYICYDPPTDAPPVATLPAASAGRVTFGSFNILAKTTPEILGVWARILHRVPHSRLLLKNRGLDDASTVARYRQLFASDGINADRVELLGWSSPDDVLACYHRVDLALDTAPYNGGLTTCEALWMGVPVVTCPGETFASRHSLAHLTAAGFTETIARDFDEYESIAVALANDLPRLAAIRAGLRERLAASPLCDGKRFAENFTSLLREVWRRWAARDAAAGAGPDPA